MLENIMAKKIIDAETAAVIAKVKAAKSPAEQAAERKIAKGKPGSVDGRGIRHVPKAAKEPVVSDTAVVKKMKGKPAKAATPRSTYEPTAKITVSKQHEVREGSSVAKVWAMVESSKTVGDYLKKRKAAKLEGMGGLFGQFVKAGFIKVGK